MPCRAPLALQLWLSLRLRCMCKSFALDWAALEKHHLVSLGEACRSW